MQKTSSFKCSCAARIVRFDDLKQAIRCNAEKVSPTVCKISKNDLLVFWYSDKIQLKYNLNEKDCNLIYQKDWAYLYILVNFWQIIIKNRISFY